MERKVIDDSKRGRGSVS